MDIWGPFGTEQAPQPAPLQIAPESTVGQVVNPAGPQPSTYSFGQDVKQAVKEAPENLKLGTIDLTAAALDAVEWNADQFRRIAEQERALYESQFNFPQAGTVKGEIARMAIPGQYGIQQPIVDLTKRGADYLRRKVEAGREAQVKATLKDAPVTKLARSVIQGGIPSAGVALGLSVLTGNPAVGLSAFYETSGAQEYKNQLANGASLEKANLIASLSGAAEVGGEMLVFPRFVKGLTKGIPLREALMLIAENAGQEGVTGFNQTFLSVFGELTSKGVNTREAARQAFDTGVAAIPENAFVGGAVGGLTAGTGGVMSRAVRALSERATPEPERPANAPSRQKEAPQAVAANGGVPTREIGTGGQGITPQFQPQEELPIVEPEKPQAKLPTEQPVPTKASLQRTGATPGTGTWDFEKTLPEPTEAARRELLAGQHYADPLDAEAVRWHFKEAANEYAGYKNTAQQYRDFAGEVERTGKNPATGRKFSEAKAKQAVEQARREAERADEMADGIVDTTANIYGDEAAEAFRNYAEQWRQKRTKVQQETPRGQREPVPAMAPGATEAGAQGPQSGVEATELLAREKAGAKGVEEEVYSIDAFNRWWDGMDPGYREAYLKTNEDKADEYLGQEDEEYQDILARIQALQEEEEDTKANKAGVQRLEDALAAKQSRMARILEQAKNEAGLPPQARAETKPTFVVDSDGSIARVINWQGEEPVVIYPGGTGGKRPGTPQQGGGRDYEYVLDDKWTPASENDFNKAIQPSGSQRMIDLRQWREEFTAGVKKQPSSPAIQTIYTSIPAEWHEEHDLYSWGKKGLRAKGNRRIAGRKTFIWQSECEQLPTRLPKSTMDAFRAKTNEVWKIHNRGAEDYWLVPKHAAEEVRKELGPEAFKRAPKPERSPSQMLNDLINSMRRAQRRESITDGQIGENVLDLAHEMGLTEDQLSDTQKKYVKAYRDEQASQRVPEDIQGGVGQEVHPETLSEEDAERAAFQAEAQLPAEIGDFLDGIVDEEEFGTPPPSTTQADTGIFGQEIFRPATGSKQAELPDAGEQWIGREPQRPLLENLPVEGKSQGGSNEEEEGGSGRGTATVKPEPAPLTPAAQPKPEGEKPEPEPRQLSKRDQKRLKEIDKELRHLRGPGMDFAYDLAVNDGGARLRDLEAKIAALETERQALLGIQPKPKVIEVAPDVALAEKIEAALRRGDSISPEQFFAMADEAYGGTMAQGKYGPSEAYDALELGVNKWLAWQGKVPSFDLAYATTDAAAIEAVLDTIPTQKSRSGEKDLLQQFSTPPHYAYAVSWIANIRPQDVVLEPSAGVGGLAVFAKNAQARVIANEISDRRAKLLEKLGLDRVTREDAEQIHNILDEQPTVVIMNPPFSHAGTRMGAKKVIGTDLNHIEAALTLLQEGGRLVAIMGRPLQGGETTTFNAWKTRMAKQYSIRANVHVGRGVYKKYGTQFPTRVLVIDKTGPTRGEVVGGEVDSIADLMYNLQGVRNDRARIQQVTAESAVPPSTQGPGTHSGPRPPIQPATGGVGTRKRSGTRSGVQLPSGPLGATPSDVRVEAAEQVPPAPRDEGPARERKSGVAGERTGGEPVREPVQGSAGTATPSGVKTGWGEKNKLVSRSEYDAIKERLAKLKGKLPGGKEAGGTILFDPQEWSDLIKIGLFHAEAGARAFVEWSGHMVTDIGEGIRPYLKQIWDEVGPKMASAGYRLGRILDRAELGDDIFESYVPSVQIAGMQKHPGSLVESARMAAVTPAVVQYQLSIPKSLIESGKLSDVQLEQIVYAGAAHSQMLPEHEGMKYRRGYMVGDGTGVGKGREIAGIILDNVQQGRRKAIWISENQKLFHDAGRDWKAIGQDPKKLFNLSKVKADSNIQAIDGIAYVTYGTLRSKAKGKTGKERVQQLVDWFGKDYDGVIIFDEAHNMQNATPSHGGRGVKGPSQRALAGVKLQKELPNARVVYVTATAATEVSNFAFADRLGLWGRGTPFATKSHFIAEIESGGVNAMELVARDMKAMGMALSRSLSFNDGTPQGTVEQERTEHVLSADQRRIYDKLAEAWQIVLHDVHAALTVTGGDHDPRSKAQAFGQFWGTHQRFFNQVITAMQTPTVINAIEKDLAEGRSAVIQLTNTFEAAQERALAEHGRRTRSLMISTSRPATC